MARTVRNAKLDTRSARAKLPAKKSAYWIRSAAASQSATARVLRAECGLAKAVDGAHRRETTLGAADDALDADGQGVLDYAQAQAKARDWLAALHAGAAPGPYTINHCLDDYLAEL